MRKCTLAASAFFLLAIPGWSAFEPILGVQHLPPQFEAVYEVRKGNFPVGKMFLSLRTEGDKLVYESRTFPVGLAASVTSIQESVYRAVLERTEDRYRTIEFRHEVTGGNKARDEHYTFDWNSHTALVKYKDKSSTLDISPNTFDRFSVQLLLMRKPDVGSAGYTCSVISKGRLKDFAYRLVPDQSIQTKLGLLTAHKFVREKNDKKNTKYTEWYAESLHYIPVRSEKSRRGKTEISAQIMEVNWL